MIWKTTKKKREIPRRNPKFIPSPTRRLPQLSSLAGGHYHISPGRRRESLCAIERLSFYRSSFSPAVWFATRRSLVFSTTDCVSARLCAFHPLLCDKWSVLCLLLVYFHLCFSSSLFGFQLVCFSFMFGFLSLLFFSPTMTPLPTFSSLSGAEFLNYFALFFGCDKLSAEEADFLKISTQLDSPVSQVQALKDFGNNLFRQQQFGQAGGCYDAACRLLCLSLKDKIDLDLNSIISLAVSLCLNLGACANKLMGFEEALIYCSMVLNFFPRNAKALFRKAIALKKLNRFSEAHTTLEKASLTEPHNKDIIQELEDVRQSLAVNKNGKRVIVDSLNANDVRAGKMLVFPPQSQEVSYPLHRKEEDMVEIMDEASCASSQLGSASAPALASDCVPITSPAAPKDSESSRVPNETVKDSEVSQSSSINSKSPQLRFTNKKRPQNALNISSQDYDNLLHGNNLGFYHPRSMSFMRVCTPTSKTIQTGTPHDEIYGTAEVPTSSPTPEIFLNHVDVERTVELVQEEAILKVDKKTRLNSLSPYATKFSLVQFKFAAIRGFSLSKEGCRDSSISKKGRIVDCRSKCRKETVLASSKTRYLTSAGFSASFCRSTRNASTTMRMKRKDVHFIEFDAHYHPPFKKSRLFSSVASTCSISSVTWFSGSFGVANTPLFVL